MSALQAVNTFSGPGRSCQSCAVRAFCLGHGLEGENLKKFEMGRGQIRVLRREQHLFRAGDEFDTLYVVRSGAIKTLETTDDGQERITGFYLPGQILGLDGIELQRHLSSAVSLETSSVCPLPYRRLIALCGEIKGLQDQVWRAMSHEIAGKQKLLLTLGTKDAEGRLATFLLAMSERLKRMGYSATEFRLSMGRHEIGEFLGLNLETVSRVFTRFHNAGLIERERRSVRLLDMPGLLARSMGRQGYVAAQPETPTTIVPFGPRKTRAQGEPARSRPAAA